MLRPILLLVLLAASLAQGQKQPAQVTALVTQIKKETAIAFTHKVQHFKTSGAWSCAVLKVTPKDRGTDPAKVLGIIQKKGAQWAVDYVLGTSMQGALDAMKKKYAKAPRSIWPKRL